MYDFNGLYGGNITKDTCIVKLYGFFHKDNHSIYQDFLCFCFSF